MFVPLNSPGFCGRNDIFATKIKNINKEKEVLRPSFLYFFCISVFLLPIIVDTEAQYFIQLKKAITGGGLQ